MAWLLYFKVKAMTLKIIRWPPQLLESLVKIGKKGQEEIHLFAEVGSSHTDKMRKMQPFIEIHLFRR